MFKSAPKPGLALRVDEICAKLSGQSPFQLAAKTGACYLEMGQGRGEFHLEMLGIPIIITYPDFSAVDLRSDDSLSTLNHALALYYFLYSDGASPVGKWIAFSDLPGGRNYSSAFQGYTGSKLASVIKFDIQRFHNACQKAGGKSLTFGDAAYGFNPLPRLEILISYYVGDDDIPSSCIMLFEGNTAHYLPAEACALVGSSITRKIEYYL